jgi:hypothetical protein
MHWISQARLQYLESGHPTLQESTEVPEEFDDPNHHQAVAFDYYTDAYGFFLDGADAFEEQDQVLEGRYGKLAIMELLRHHGAQYWYSEEERERYGRFGRAETEASPSQGRV